jgi:MAF protein
MADSSTPSELPPDYDTAAAQSLPIRTLPAAGTRKGPPGPLPALQIPILKYLRTKRVILASASPRRRALLAQLSLTKLEIRPSNKPEDLPKSEYGPYEYVSATARRKCLDIYEELLIEQHKAAQDGSKSAIPADPDVVIAADTIILARDGRILEKPRSEVEHVRMLKHLRDTVVHRVLTAVVVLAPKADASHPGYEIATHTEETKVFFASIDEGLPDDVIEAYVKTREGADKAGGYALQGIGGMLMVTKIEGSVDNVIGLPVRKCLQLCEKVIFRQGEDEEADEDED